jgi:hypothetical protein
MDFLVLAICLSGERSSNIPYRTIKKVPLNIELTLRRKANNTVRITKRDYCPVLFGMKYKSRRESISAQGIIEPNPFVEKKQ